MLLTKMVTAGIRKFVAKWMLALLKRAGICLNKRIMVISTGKERLTGGFFHAYFQKTSIQVKKKIQGAVVLQLETVNKRQCLMKMRLFTATKWRLLAHQQLTQLIQLYIIYIVVFQTMQI